MTSTRRFAATAVRRATTALGALLLAATGLLTSAPAASAAPVAPDATGFPFYHLTFETPVVTPDTFELFTVGERIGPWTVTRGDVHLMGAGFWQAGDGVQSVDLDGGMNGGIARRFSTLPGLPYRLSFDLAGNPADLPMVKTGYVSVNGQQEEFSFDVTGATYEDMNYTREHVQFVATGFSTTIEFVSTGEPEGFGPVIDDVDLRLCLPIFC